MAEYIFIQVVILIVFVTVLFRIIQNIRVDKRINRIFLFNRSETRYLQGEFKKVIPSVNRYIFLTGAQKRQAPHRLKINFRGMYHREGRKDWWRFIIKSYVNMDQKTYLFDGCMRVFPGMKARFIDELSESGSSFELYLSSAFKYLEGAGESFEYNAVLNYMLLCFLSPIYLIQEDFEWQELAENRAQVCFNKGAVTVDAMVSFSENGRVESIRTQRYKKDGESYHKQLFEVSFEKYAVLDHERIPFFIRFYWVMDGNLENFANFEIIKGYTK